MTNREKGIYNGIITVLKSLAEYRCASLANSCSLGSGKLLLPDAKSPNFLKFGPQGNVSKSS